MPEEQKPYQQQPYDSTLKSLLRDQAEELLSLFVEGAEYQDELSEESLKPPLRADRVYLVTYRGKLHVLHIELETATDSEIGERLLEYFGILYRKYKRPMISLVLYPFRTRLPESPLRVTVGDDDVLIFHYRVIAFWKLKAQQYLDRHDVSIYALLPTMDGADYALLAQALDEMKKWYTGQARKLATQLLWFGTFLKRTDTVSLEDKRRLQKKMDQFDSLLEENPFVQKKSAEAEERGKVIALQSVVVKVVRGRFPALAELAQEQVTKIDKPDALDFLFDKVSTAPDEATVRFLLNSSAA